MRCNTLIETFFHCSKRFENFSSLIPSNARAVFSFVSLWRLFSSGETKKRRYWARSGGNREVGHRGQAVFGQKLLNTQRGVGSCLSERGTNFAASRFMPKSSDKICWQKFHDTPVISTSLSIVWWRSFTRAERNVAIVWSVLLVEERTWSEVDRQSIFRLVLKRENHSYTCVLLRAPSL